MSDAKLPPGQRWVEQPIIYDIGPVPPVDITAYKLRLTGKVDNPLELSWDEILRLPQAEVIADFHCVTGWSVRDVRWEGVSTQTIVNLIRPKPGVNWVMAYGREGYTTNVPYDHFCKEGSILAYRMNGEDLLPEHGYPLRLVIPSLYAWKSAKYVVAMEFLAELRRGFWEERGYHEVGEPWQEERYR